MPALFVGNRSHERQAEQEKQVAGVGWRGRGEQRDLLVTGVRPLHPDGGGEPGVVRELPAQPPALAYGQVMTSFGPEQARVFSPWISRKRRDL